MRTWVWIVFGVVLAGLTYLAGIWTGRRSRPAPRAHLIPADTSSSVSTSIVPVDTVRYKDRIADEHFWFTATTLGLNGFLISQAAQWRLGTFAALWVGFLNLYGLYLVVHRAASHAGKLMAPPELQGRSQRERTYRDKLIETKYNLGTVCKHVPFVLFECSGALFFILLIITSYFGMLFAHHVL